MEALFLKLVNMSITASWFALAVMAVRFLFHKLPKGMVCILWGLVAVRLICPFSLESDFSLIPDPEPLPPEIIYTAHPQIHSGVEFIDSTVNPMLESSMAPSELSSANPTQIWSFLLSRVWVLGLAGMLLYALGSYGYLRWKVATAIPVRQNIKRCEFIDTPFVLGFLFPVIYLPATLEKKEWQYVLAHEEAHIQRHDHWWKPIGYLLLSIYWFNPVLWIAYILLCRDIEAACDEMVIRNMDQDARKAYSTALLSASVHRRSIAACPLAFGEVGIKERIQYVMHYKKPAIWVIRISAILLIAISVAFLTNPEKQYDPEKVYPQAFLPDPDRIVIDTDGADSIYENDSVVYRRLLDVFRINWWKYTPEGLETAPYSALVTPAAPELLKTNTWQTYRELGDTLVCFQYTSNPIIWENADGEQTKIETIAFLIPDKSWTEENTRGVFLISQTDYIGINEGLYTYYYPAEITSDFFDFVLTAKASEVTKVSGRTLSLDTVIRLSGKGSELTLGDFEGFAYEEQGDTLLYTRKYPISAEWYLLIHHGGGLEKPISVWLTNAYTGEFVDITLGNGEGAITEFIADQEGKKQVHAWFDMYASDSQASSGMTDHPQLPGAQGVTLQLSSIVDGKIQISSAPGEDYKTVIAGQLIRSVYLCDLTGDGVAEVCACVSLSDGIQIHIYDYTEDRLYRMENPQGQYSVLTSMAGRLLVLRKDNATGYTVGYGQLTMKAGMPHMGELDGEMLALTRTISCVDISNRKSVCVSHPDQIRQLLTILKDLNGQVIPLSPSQMEAYKADPFDYRYIVINYGIGEKALYFSEDYSVVWEFGQEGGYLIQDPQPLRSFVASVTDGVWRYSAGGMAFATKDTPWDWCAGIRLDAVESVEAYISKYQSGGTKVSTNGVLSATMSQKLFSILNGIPKEVFSQGSITGKDSFWNLMTDVKPENSAIAIRDGVNGLAAVIRTDGEKIELILTNETEKVSMENHTYLEPTQIWIIRDDNLLKFFRELTEYVPIIHYSVGAEYAWQAPVSFSRDGFSMELRLIEGWEAEYVTNAADSGIRCRPQGVTSGWIYFSYWPDGYTIREQDRYYGEGSAWGGYPTVTSYPGSVESRNGVDLTGAVWSYKKTDLNAGDYVVINQGADSWFLQYKDQIEDTMTLVDFKETE